MFIEIISPEKILYRGNIDSLVVPGALGEFEILKDHAAIISELVEGQIKLKGTVEAKKPFYKNKKEETVIDITSGTLDVDDNKVVLLID